MKANDSQGLILVENAAENPHTEVEDLHLVLEYSEGETINGITTPRDNRFYIVRDFKGKTLETFETYRSSLAAREDFRKHIFGGFQLLEALEPEALYQRVREIGENWKTMRANGKILHLELGDFDRVHTIVNIEKELLTQVDSVGLNE